MLAPTSRNSSTLSLFFDQTSVAVIVVAIEALAILVGSHYSPSCMLGVLIGCAVLNTLALAAGAYYGKKQWCIAASVAFAASFILLFHFGARSDIWSILAQNSEYPMAATLGLLGSWTIIKCLFANKFDSFIDHRQKENVDVENSGYLNIAGQYQTGQRDTSPSLKERALDVSRIKGVQKNDKLPKYAQTGMALIVLALNALALLSGSHHSEAFMRGVMIGCITFNAIVLIGCILANKKKWSLAATIALIASIVLLTVIKPNHDIWSTIAQNSTIPTASAATLLALGLMMTGMGRLKQSRFEIVDDETAPSADVRPDTSVDVKRDTRRADTDQRGTSSDSQEPVYAVM